MSPDRTKLYIAVRFDSKSMAREVMERYNGNEMLGYKVELTFFRDIRRYLAHCAKKGVRPNRFRDDGAGSGRKRDRGRSRSRSRSGAPKSNSQSASRSRSRSAASPSRSRSVSSGDRSSQRSQERDKSLDYSDIVMKKERPPSPSPTPPPIKKSKKVKRKERKHKRRHSPSPSPKRHSSDGSEAEDNKQSNGTIATQKVFIGPTKPPSPQREQQQPISFSHRHLSAGTVAASAINESKLVKPKLEMYTNQVMTDGYELTNASYQAKFKPFGETAKVDSLLNGSKERVRMNSEQQSNMSSSPPPALRNMPMPNMAKGNLLDQEVAGTGGIALNNFIEIQRAILHDVRYKPNEKIDEDDGMMGSLRLSSLSRKAMTEEKREEKIAKLSPELRERVNKKKRQLELSYRSDCETYGLVANKLIAKDRSLEDSIKVALLDALKELEAETMKQLDAFLDQLSFMF